MLREAMVTTVAGFVLLSSLLCSTTGVAFNLNCGIEPIPPIGCKVGDCLCDQSGRNCHYQFVCNDSNTSGAFRYQMPPQTDFATPLGSIGNSIGGVLRKWRQNTLQASTGSGCPDKPGMPIHGCPATEWPAGVKAADKAWFKCLWSSMPTQMTQYPDLNQAAEASFSACQTEEQGLRATLVAESHLTPDETSTAMAYLKPIAKQHLLAAVAKAQSANPH